MTEWKDIHPDLTNELQWDWHNRKFTAEQTQEWINIGLKPTDFSFAVYLRDIISCSPEEVLNFGDLETLKEQHQEYLKSQDATEADEAQTLADAIRLSLSIFSPDDLLSKFSDQELEKYLSEKRLDLKKYFVFNLGREVETIPQTVSDVSGEVVSETIPNLREVKPLLAKHLTQLFNDGHEKSAISFTGKNTNQPSLGWMGEKLDHKIKNGEECYIAFDKSKINANSNYIRGIASSPTPLGELYWGNIIVLAVEAQPQVKVFQSKKNALKFLRENEFKCKAVSCPEEIIGEQDYCLYHQTCLAKLEEKQEIPNIQEIDTFETWFNGNCGYVINKDSISNVKHPFRFWLIIYEPEYKSGKAEEYWAIMNIWNYERFIGAQRRAREIKSKLCDDNLLTNPFAIHWKADEHTAFADLVCEPYVRVINLPYEEEEGIVLLPVPPTMTRIPAKVKLRVPNKNPDNYLKPLDVFWVKKNFVGFDFYHVGIYLGNRQICDVPGTPIDKKGARIRNWEEFVNGCVEGEVIGYHPVLPFKHRGLISKQIAWTKSVKYREGDYCLANQNCEHFSNMIIYGIEYSEQVRRRPQLASSIATYEGVNKGKSSAIKLTDEIIRTNEQLGQLSDSFCQEIEQRAQIVVPPKKDCKIM